MTIMDQDGARKRQCAIEPSAVASAILIYVVPTLVFFVVEAIGLWRLPGTFWGMYGNDDGIWAAWNLQGIFEWSVPFDLAPFNPLSGMGSTFLPNTPWLNPAAAALALPFPREIDYLISYFLYFVELTASLILLFRVIGLSPLRSAICAQLYLVVVFPWTNGYFATLYWYSLSPSNAHLVAMANIMLALLLLVGRFESARNIACVIGFALAALSGVFSAPVNFLTYGPTYAIAAAALLLGFAPDRRELGWKIGAVAATALLLWLLGLKDYYEATSWMSNRAVLYPRAFEAGWRILTLEFWRHAWSIYNTCDNQVLICARMSSFWIYVGALAGAVLYSLNSLRRSELRPLAIALLMFVAFVHFFDLTGRVALFGAAHVISPAYLIWASYPFLVLFLGLLVFRAFDLAGGLLARAWLLVPSRLSAVVPEFRTLRPAVVALLIPVLALHFWFTRGRNTQPPPPSGNPSIPLLGKSAIRHATIGSITSYLIDHASIRPGTPFRGYTVTYLGDPRGPLTPDLKIGPSTNFGLYVAARYVLDRLYQNRLQETDLWELGIPTLEEYGQWITKPVYATVDAVANRGEETAPPGVVQAFAAFLHLYRLRLDVLAFLGVRFVITDLPLQDDRATLRVQQPGRDAPPMFLYEMAGPNLGTWSPTKFTVARSFSEALQLLRANVRDLARTAIVFEALPQTLVPAERAEFGFMRGGFRLTADAAGEAAVVLPMQYSKCWQLAAASSDTDRQSVSVQRVNAFQTLVRFRGHIDASFKFAFGRLGGTHCRMLDVAELRLLGMN